MTPKERLIELIMDSVGGCARNWAEVIADHLLKNGIIVPPCKVGDVVYQTAGVRIYEGQIKEIIYDTGLIVFDERAIGNTVFLTREGAEKALAERGK